MPEDKTLDSAVATIALLARRPVMLGAEARARVLLAVDAEMRCGRPGTAPRRHAWLEPRPLRISPLVGLAVAAGLVGFGVLLGALGQERPQDGVVAGPEVAALAPATNTPAGGAVAARGTTGAEVKFVLVAPQASRVTVVGDFNGWNPEAHPMERTPTGGTWTVTVPLEAGRHEYSFVVDGEHWMPDPSAPLAPEDGFGVANSVLLVSRSAS